MGEFEHGWDAEEEWHPMFRMYYGQYQWDEYCIDIRSMADYADKYWEQQRQRDADGLPEVWE